MSNEMQAGRELDALVAERVFSRTVDVKSRAWQDGYMCEGTFYSTDIAAAWDVLNRFGFVVGPWFTGGVAGPDGYTPRQGWLVYRDWEESMSDAYSPDGTEYAIGKADTLPLAICRAALRALEATR